MYFQAIPYMPSTDVNHNKASNFRDKRPRFLEHNHQKLHEDFYFFPWNFGSDNQDIHFIHSPSIKAVAFEKPYENRGRISKSSTGRWSDFLSVL